MTPAEEGFDAFYADRFVGLAAQISVYLGDRAEAEDVVQEAFCRAWRHWSQISGDPAPWVHTVAYRLAASRWRRLKVALAYRHRARPQEVPPPDAERLDLMTALAGLPDAQRRAIVLHYLADLSVEQIAEREGVAAGTVKSWLHRGRTRLATTLGPEQRPTRFGPEQKPTTLGPEQKPTTLDPEQRPAAPSPEQKPTALGAEPGPTAPSRGQKPTEGARSER